MIGVRHWEPDLERDYQRMLSSDPRTMIYATTEYRNFLSAVVPGQSFCLLALDGNEVVGSLPFFEAMHPELGVVINSFPWYGSHGGCTLAAAAGKDVRRVLLRAYAEIISRPAVISATLILTPDENVHLRQYQQILEASLIDTRIGQITVLPEDGSDLDRRLESILAQKTRNLVRKALKQGLVYVTSDEDWAWRFLYETHAANMAAIGGRAKRWEHFQALRKCLPISWRRIWVASEGSRPVAALLLLYFNRTVEYFTPVILHEYRPRQPLSFLIQHAIADAVRKGYRWWNWGGTWASQKALHHFKAGWGAEDRSYTYLINIGGQGLQWLQAKQDQLQDVFPYYYTHPYHVKG